TTEPLPVSYQPSTLPTAPAPAPSSGLRTAKRPLLRRVVWLGVLLTMVGVLTTEGVACVAAERFRHTVESIEGRSVAERMGEYDRIRGWSVLDVGLRWRVNDRLRQRLGVVEADVRAD